jgi:putative transient receptor potential channel
MTALHLAAKHGHIEVMRALKDSIDFKMHSRRNGLTALHVAASSGQTDCVSELLIHVPGGIPNEKCTKEPNGEVMMFKLVTIYANIVFTLV